MSVDKRQESALQMPESRDRFMQIMEIKNQYISDLEKLSGKKSSDLSPDEKILVKNASEFAKVLQEQKIQKEVYTQQAQELLDVLKRSISKTQAVEDSTKKQLADIKTVEVKSQPVATVDLTNNSTISQKLGQKNKLQNIPTGEKNSEFWGTFSGDTNRAEYYNKNPQIRVSLGDYFRGKSKSDMMILKEALYTELIKLKGDKITPLNNGALIEILEKAGYKFNNVFKSEEIVNFYHTLNNMLQTQDKITSSSIEKDKIKILLDNGDGLLEAGNGEVANLFHTVEALHLNEKKGDGFGALIENLGLGNKEDFFASMGENLYSARERFRRAFDAMNGRYNITELVKKGKLQETTDLILKEHQDFERAFEQRLQTFFAANIDKNNNLIQVAPEVKEKFKQDFKNKFNIQSLSFSHVNGGVGLGAGVNIQELTSGVLDSLSVGLTDDGSLGLSVNKGLFTEVLSKYGSSVVVGISHTLSPFLGVSQKLTGQAYTSQELFELSRERAIGTTVSGSVSTGAKVLSVNFSRIDHNTSSGIEQMSVGMEKLLTEEVARDILLGKAEYSKEGATPREQEVYGQMKSAFDTATSGMDAKEKQDFMKIFIHSYVNAYRNELYRNAEGMKLTSFGIGVISIEGFYNLPFLTLGGEKISTQTREVPRAYERQEKITHTGVDLRKAGGKIATQEGYQVLELPTEFTSDKLEGTKGEMQISVSPESKSQIKIENGKIYIGGDISLNNITLVEQTENGMLTRTLVIDKGMIDENGMYLSSYEPVDVINRGLNIQLGTKPVSEKLVGLDIKQEEAGVKDISEKLTQIISFDALKDKDTPGLTQLQKDIFTFRQNGTPALSQVWNNYIKVIGDKNFIKYAMKGGKIDGINFMTFLNENKQISDDTHKVYILQALAMGLTSKGKLILDGENYKVNQGKQSISEYNTAHKRDQFFDTMMKKEVPSVASDITLARHEWNNKFGNLNSYSKFTRETGLALSGTQVGKETGLTPLSDRYDLIGSERDLIKIENLDNKKKTELVNKIPTYVLEGYLKQLQQLGVSVNGIQGVKNFIIKGGIEKIKINMDVFFAKNAQCINDAVVMDIKVTKDGEEIPLVIGAAATSSSFVQDINAFSFGVVGAGRLEEIEEPKPTDNEPDKNPDNKPDKNPDNKPDKNPDNKPDKNPDNKPDKNPDNKPDKVDNSPDKVDNSPDKVDNSPDKNQDNNPVKTAPGTEIDPTPSIPVIPDTGVIQTPVAPETGTTNLNNTTIPTQVIPGVGDADL